jgi:hypothetical protein
MLRASATSVGRGLASTRNLVTQDASRGAKDAGERAGTSEAERRERLCCCCADDGTLEIELLDP